MHSYRELPLRYGEFGQCHRNESSGALHGLMRVRGFTQDDGHIFCTEDQIQSEVADFDKAVRAVYQDLVSQRWPLNWPCDLLSELVTTLFGIKQKMPCAML